jgi:hypothetical protein
MYKYVRNSPNNPPKYNPAHTGAKPPDPTKPHIGAVDGTSFWDTRVGAGSPHARNAGIFEKVIPRRVCPELLSKAERASFKRGKVSGADLRALNKSLFLRNQDLVTAKPELVLLELLNQIAADKDPVLSAWARANPGKLKAFFGLCSHGTAMATISNIRIRDADIEVEHNKEYWTWLLWTLGVPSNTPAQVANAIRTRSQRRWLTGVRTASTLIMRANNIRMNHPKDLAMAPCLEVYKVDCDTRAPIAPLTIDDIMSAVA